MNSDDFKFIGWKRDEEENVDKVYGVIKLDKNPVGPCVRFWGRRGKKLSTMMDTDTCSLDQLIDTKIDSGYIEVNFSKLNEVYPEFKKDLAKTKFWASFKIT